MSVLVIRANKRFAVCQRAHLREAGKSPEPGLLIELSLQGGRVSNLDPQAFALDQQVTLGIEGATPLEARVRWLGEGTVGLRFLRPLHNAALDQLIRLCRGETKAAPILSCAG